MGVGGGGIYKERVGETSREHTRAKIVRPMAKSKCLRHFDWEVARLAHRIKISQQMFRFCTIKLG